MGDYELPDKEIDNIIKNLVELPIKNIEKKIKNLEEEIKKRKNISNRKLSCLGTRKLNLENKSRKIIYSGSLEFTINKQIAFEKELFETILMSINECLSYVKDISKLKEKLIEAEEELELEKEKKKLVK